MLDYATKRRFKPVLVVTLDRAFRRVKDMYDTLSTWVLLGVEFKSMREQFDTSTANGRLLLTILAAVAEFELGLISERVKAGMSRAAKRGVPSRRPALTSYRDCKWGRPPRHFDRTGHREGESAEERIRQMVNGRGPEGLNVTHLAKEAGWAGGVRGG